MQIAQVGLKKTQEELLHETMSIHFLDHFKSYIFYRGGIEFMGGGGVIQNPPKIFPSKTMETYQEKQKKLLW